jgi:nucleotide-binding universal stress UspA family protein
MVQAIPTRPLETAIALGEKLRSRVLVVVVAPLSGLANVRDVGANARHAMKRCEQRLDELIKALDTRNLWLETEIIMAAEQLLDRARQERVDLMILGLQANRVVKYDPCPVMFVA